MILLSGGVKVGVGVGVGVGVKKRRERREEGKERTRWRVMRSGSSGNRGAFAEMGGEGE